MFIHLHLHSPWSFLDGASDIEDLVRTAAGHGMPALALTDHDNLCAAVKFTTSCRAYGIRPILGAEVTMEDDTHLTLLARNVEGYTNLCRLLTESHTFGGRLNAHLPWRALSGEISGLICLSGCRRGRVASRIRLHDYEDARAAAESMRQLFGNGFYIELQDDLTPGSGRVCREAAEMADHMGIPVVATNNVHYADAGGLATHDILRCIATHTTVLDTHPDRPLNAERRLKSPEEMAALFNWRPDALENTIAIADACESSLPEEINITPAYPIPEGYDAPAYLRRLTYKGAAARYGPLNPIIGKRLEHELEVITCMGYADYFLMVWSVVRWARKQGIRVTGRGSAADSCVAYCLYLTDVDVIQRNLPFARFLAEGKTPDIDSDFPSERRDDVFRYIRDRYGEEHVGMVCTFHTFRARSAVRDVGKALALPQESLEFLSERLHHFLHADQIDSAFERHAELKQHVHLRDRYRLLFQLCARIADFPRHIGTHSSGIVISRTPLHTVAPLQPSARGLVRIWTLDKDDAEQIGAIKFDVLSLRALSAVNDAEQSISRSDPSFRYDRIPLDDRETFRMMRAGQAVGAFQFESAAQMNLASTLDITQFEDLVAAVALIRPGPVRGNNVQRFVACRNGWARADWVHPSLRRTLAKTYGCIVFQEQINDIVATMTGCSDAEADRFRKSLTRHARRNTMDDARRDFVERTLIHHADMDEERAHHLFDQMEGWSGYGFTEGHAASFAITGFRTAYLSLHHPAAHFAGMMNHQPMGFFSNNTLASEARRRGVRICPVDINRSGDKSTVTDGGAAIQLGLRLVADLREDDIAAILAGRELRPYTSLLDFCARVLIHRDRLENLILTGAFDLLHEHRRGLLWRLDETLALARECRRTPGSLDIHLSTGMPTPIAWDVADFSPWDRFLWSWRLTGVCADCHPFAYLRDDLQLAGISSVYAAQQAHAGAHVTVAGLNIRPHRPPTRSGEPVLFTLLEDETGLFQSAVTGGAIDRCTATFVTAPAVLVTGTIGRRGRGVTLNIDTARPLRMHEIARVDPMRDHMPPPDRLTAALRPAPIGLPARSR